MSVALVQKFNGTAPNPGAETVSAVATSNVTAGNILVAIWSMGEITTGGPSATISDTQGNIWNQILTQVSIDTSLIIIVYYAVAKASGANTITVDVGAGNTAVMQLQMAEFSGVPTPYFDAKASRFNVAHASFSTGTVTTTANGDLLIACVILPADQINDWSVDNGFTLQLPVLNVDIGSGLSQSFAWATLLSAGAAGPYSTDWTTAQIVNSTEEIAGVVAFLGPQVTGTTLLDPPSPRRLPRTVGHATKTEGKHLFLR